MRRSPVAGGAPRCDTVAIHEPGARDPMGRTDTSRLVYGYANGRTHGPRRTALGIAAARGIDGALGHLGLVRPRLLVSGFWRSGTTWLLESLAAALGAKTVFEPLAPMEAAHRAFGLEAYLDDDEDLRQATILGPQAPGSPLWPYLDRVCRGSLSTRYLLSCRETVGQSWRRAAVIKDVRLQANLAAFHARYGVPVVHLRRHPCAVVASLRAADWHWSFARTPLATLLPRLGTSLDEDRRAAALAYDTDALARTAAFWALTEAIAAATLAGQPWGAVLPYERFAADPAGVLAGLCRSLGLVPRDPVDFSAPSATVDPAAFAAYGAPPPKRWRRLLSGAEIDRVEAIADALYPAWRTDPSDFNPQRRP